MPKERHRANKKSHKHSPSKVFAHGVIKITILTTKDGPKLKRAPGLKQMFIIRTSWNRDIKPTELVHAAAAELGCDAVYNGGGAFPGHVFVNITVKSFMHVFKRVATARAPNMTFNVHIQKEDRFQKRFLEEKILTNLERVYAPDSSSESDDHDDDSESEAEKKKPAPARKQKKPKADDGELREDEDSDDTKKAKKAKSSHFVVYDLSSDEEAPPKVKKANNNAEASSSGVVAAEADVAKADGRRASQRKRKKATSRDLA